MPASAMHTYILTHTHTHHWSQRLLRVSQAESAELEQRDSSVMNKDYTEVVNIRFVVR